MTPVVCVDFGSTFTKAAAVDRETGDLLATATHRTTIGTDVLDGWAACHARLADQLPGVPLDEVRACSSAGGGLRLAVVGYERAVTAEAGSRVGLTAGARLVHVSAGELDRAGAAALQDDRPDVVLLVGGTDGGNADVLVHNAGRLAGSELKVPVVVAGNADARDEACEVLGRRAKQVIATANVLPRIGVLDPGPARAAIREVFIRHVIGGKALSSGSEFAAMVRAATPDSVLTGVELLAEGYGDVPGMGDVVVVDVGGATTDVYSVVTPDAEEASLHREVVEVLWRGRTVEGDLGVRWNAVGIVDAAVAEKLVGPADLADLRAAAAHRAREPAYLPESTKEATVDATLAGLAVRIGLRRHARPQHQPGKDLRQVRLVVGSGGVLRHAGPAAAREVLATALRDHAGGWRVPERARLAVDRDCVLAAAGLLAEDAPQAAARLLQNHLSRADG